MAFWLLPWIGALIVIGASLRALRAAQVPEPASGEGCASVTIVVPARNEAPRMQELIESVLAQDHPDYELVVVDDGSTDRTLEAARAAAKGDPRVRFLRVDERPPGWQGKLYAVAVGARGARNDWLLFLDADKRLTSPSLLRALLTDCERRGVAAGSVLGPYVGEQWWQRWWYRPIVDNPVVAGGALLVQMLRAPTIWLLVTVAMRRETYEEVGGAAAAALYAGGVFDDWGWTSVFERRRLPTAMVYHPALHDVTNWESFADAWAGMSRWVAGFLVCRRGAWPILALGVAAVFACALATAETVMDLASLRLPEFSSVAVAAILPTFGLAYCRARGYRLGWALLAAPVALGVATAFAGGVWARIRNRARWRDQEFAVVSGPPTAQLSDPRP